MKHLIICLGIIAMPSFAAATEVRSAGHPSQLLHNKAPLNDRPLMCGDLNAPPTAIFWNDSERQPRHCGPPGNRNYVPSHGGIGFDILRFESEACFVPDESFQLLDSIV